MLGVASAYFGGTVDLLLQRLMDIFLAFPLIVLALAVVAVLGTGIHERHRRHRDSDDPARRARGAVERAVDPRDAVRRRGARRPARRTARIILRHMLPNVFAPYLIMLTAFLGQAILLEASLSFLGLGVCRADAGVGPDAARAPRCSSPSRRRGWRSSPGLAISLAVFAFNLFGDSLRDALDPSSARSSDGSNRRENMLSQLGKLDTLGIRVQRPMPGINAVKRRPEDGVYHR